MSPKYFSARLFLVFRNTLKSSCYSLDFEFNEETNVPKKVKSNLLRKKQNKNFDFSITVQSHQKQIVISRRFFFLLRSFPTMLIGSSNQSTVWSIRNPGFVSSKCFGASVQWTFKWSKWNWKLKSWNKIYLLRDNILERKITFHILMEQTFSCLLHTK